MSKVSDEVRDVIERLREMLKADGADLELVARDGSTISLRLIVTDEACLDCIMPAAHIEAVVLSSVSRVTDDVAHVNLVDPRIEVAESND